MLGPLSLRGRLIIGVVALAAVGLAVADAVTYSSLRSFLVDRTDGTLRSDAHGIDRVGSLEREAERLHVAVAVAAP
jgi:hypothetical protein